MLMAASSAAPDVFPRCVTGESLLHSPPLLSVPGEILSGESCKYVNNEYGKDEQITRLA
jgi:hypothetical protein